MGYTKETKAFLKNLGYNLPQKSICEAHTLYCLNWYSQKAVFYKFFYYVLCIMNISAPLASSLLLTYFELDFISTILSALTSFSASLLSLYHVRDKWTNYRTTAEYIKEQYVLYLVQSPPYNTAECHIIYLNTLQNHMRNTHSHWLHTQNDTNKHDTK